MKLVSTNKFPTECKQEPLMGTTTLPLLRPTMSFPIAKKLRFFLLDFVLIRFECVLLKRSFVYVCVCRVAHGGP